MTTKKKILSGMRPSGKLHLGNYVGALSQWVDLQYKYKCFFMIADWHALTTEYQNTKELKNNVVDVILDWLAVGLNPEQATIFVQSEVKQHAELSLLLSMFTPLAWLERCPTYKDQIKQLENKEIETHGFIGYPVLQAADIVIYKADCVPIGEDQVPHLELTREIVRRFNFYHGDTFIEPQAILSKTPRLLGFDGRKMSKSYNNCIFLSDSKETILEKSKLMITDPARIKKSDLGHPEVCSVFDYQKVFNSEAASEIDSACRKATIGCVECKKKLAETINNLFEPWRGRRAEFESKPGKIKDIILSGNDVAKKTTEETMVEVRERLNLNYFGK